jgi:pheromone shutdown protein TraB
LIPLKVRDHQREDAEFVGLLEKRMSDLKTLPELRADFVKEMQRFLPAATVRDIIEKDAYWAYLLLIVSEQSTKAIASIR